MATAGSGSEECCLPLGEAVWEPSGSGDGGTKGTLKNKVEAGCVSQVPVLKGQT